jgi:hypothetical protein
MALEIQEDTKRPLPFVANLASIDSKSLGEK